MGTGDFETLPIPCPDCGQLSPERVQHLIQNDVIPCSICGGLIDLSAPECRPLVERAKGRSASETS